MGSTVKTARRSDNKVIQYRVKEASKRDFSEEPAKLTQGIAEAFIQDLTKSFAKSFSPGFNPGLAKGVPKVIPKGIPKTCIKADARRHKPG